MAKQQPARPATRTRASADLPAGSFPLDDEAAARQIESEAELLSVVEQLGNEGAGGRVNVYREGPGGHNDIEFCDTYTPAEFSIKQVQADYGAGLYRAHVQDGASGEMVLNRRFRVGKPRSGVVPNSEKVQAPAAVAPAAQAAPDLLAFMREQQTAMIGAFKEMAASLRGAPVAPAPGMGTKEVIELFTTLQSMMTPKGGGERGGLAMARELIELSNAARPPVDGDGNFNTAAALLRVAEKYLAPLSEVVTQSIRSRGAPSLPAPPGAAPAAVTGAASVTDLVEPAAGASQDFASMLRAFGPLIVANARADNDPVTYANLILDAIPAEQLRPYLVEDGWFDALCVALPDARPYSKWFGELRAVILEETAPVPAPLFDGDGKPGHDSEGKGAAS